MTAALEGDEWSAARPGRTLPPGKTRYPFYRRLNGPQGGYRRAENLAPTGIRFRTVQPVVSRYTDWATRSTHTHTYIYIYIYIRPCYIYICVVFMLEGHYICFPCDVKLLREDVRVRLIHAVTVYVSKNNIFGAHLLYLHIYILLLY